MSQTACFQITTWNFSKINFAIFNVNLPEVCLKTEKLGDREHHTNYYQPQQQPWSALPLYIISRNSISLLMNIDIMFLLFHCWNNQSLLKANYNAVLSGRCILLMPFHLPTSRPICWYHFHISYLSEPCRVRRIETQEGLRAAWLHVLFDICGHCIHSSKLR